MHQHKLDFSAPAGHGYGPVDRWEYVRQFGFAAAVGFLLILNVTGSFRYLLGVDTAALLTIAAGYRTFYNAVHALLEKTISADLAICIAVLAALSVGEYLAAAEAMFIMLVGEGLEGYATKRTSAAIERFVERMPRRARLVKDGGEIEVDAAALLPGDAIAVRAGERMPADGLVDQGASAVDESAITGESVPRDKQPGDEVFTGSLNGHGLLRIRVTRAGSETTLARVIRLVEEARLRKAPVERLADRFARYFVPALLGAGAGTYYFTGDWMRTVSVLIVGCPCALILATPAAMVAGMGGLARRGILVRGGAVLQQAAKIDAIVFDKTGTLTEGQFEVLRISGAAEGGRETGEAIPAAAAMPAETSAEAGAVLRLAAAAESGSGHVLARVIVAEARKRGVEVPAPESARILPGRGAECVLDGRPVRAGSAAYLAAGGVDVPAADLEEADRLGATAVWVAEGSRFRGAILLRDRVRAGAREALRQLRGLDIGHQVLLTGDRRPAAEAIARELDLPHVEAGLLPEQKLERIRQLAAAGRTVAMAGDGVNDAPALAAAHVGIAVSGAADISAEAAGVVYMGQSLRHLPELVRVARKAVAIAWQNIIGFALIVNVVAIGFASSGQLGPLGAAVTHQAASLLVMLNALRLLAAERPGPSRLTRVLAWGKLWLSRLEPDRIEPKAWFHMLREHRRRLLRVGAPGVAAAVALSGLYIVGPEEVGLIERFGRKVMPYREPGLHYKLPWPVEKLTRLPARRIRTVELGFRTASGPGASGEPAGAEPAAYEWNTQHRGGRFQRRPEESLMLSGDQNMMEVTAAVHFRIVRAGDYLFRNVDTEALVRAAAESVLQSVTGSAPLEDALTLRRTGMEARAARELQRLLDRYRTGVEVHHVKLLEVHPSVEVVDAFRGVSGAYEEKIRLINEAEGYLGEQVALARGQAEARLQAAAAHSSGRKNRAAGDAARFTQFESAFRGSPEPNQTRLYLETMETILPGRRKLIVDTSRGRRHLLLADDGVEIGPGVAVPPSPPARRMEEERD